MTGPLSGMRILTVEEYGVGPFATQLLADMGADVIKIENAAAGGDSSRRIPPFQHGNDSLYFESLNRGKRSVVLDLKSDDGRADFHALVARSDGVLNNLRATTARRLGLRYADLREVNPRIVCCSASGWGTDGPQAANPAYDYLLQAYIGNMAMTGEPDAPPARSAVPWVDTSTGIAAALGLVSGIWSAGRTGEGADVDVSMADVGMSQWMYLATWYLSGGLVPHRQTMSRHPSVVPSQLFATKDGHLILMIQTQAFWSRFCVEAGIAELADDERFATFAARRENVEALMAVLEPLLASRTSDEWIDRLAGAVPAGKVNSFAEAMDRYAEEYPGQILEWEHEVLGTVRSLAGPIRFDGRTGPARRAPRLGEHTDEVIESIRSES